MAHFRYQQEPTVAQSLQLQYLRLLFIALVMFLIPPFASTEDSMCLNLLFPYNFPVL